MTHLDQSLITESLFETDSNAIEKYFESIKELIPWKEEVHSWHSCLSVRPEDPTNLEAGFDGKVDERVYSLLHSAYNDSVVASLIEQIGQPVFRLRWMILKPRSCYSLHSDPSYRIHIPIQTSEKSFLMFPEQSHVVHLPASHAYRVDTTKMHTAVNTSSKPRLHLVGSIYE